MTLSIAEALQQAEEAINGGDYQAAATTCDQLIGQFPAFGAAWTTLGEAYREQGNSAEAERAYAAALQRNYRNPAVYLGLGLLAEEQGVSENALAFCQVAWELAPQHGHLREPLTRVALRRFGSDGDLQYSRAALAQLHVNGQRLRRAVEEYRRALATLPERVDLQLGLAECLWRLGQDVEAATISQAVLEAHPEASQALVILAEIEHRTGNARKGDELLKRLRAVDPDGALASSMAAGNPRADRGWLEVAAQALPFLSEFLPAAPVERPRIAPAPDFDYRPSRSEVPAPAMEELTPFSLAEFGATTDDLLAPPAPVELHAFPELDDLGITEEPFTLNSLGLPAAANPLDALPESVLPLDPAEFARPFDPLALGVTDAVAATDGVEASDPFADFTFDMPARLAQPAEDVLAAEAVEVPRVAEFSLPTGIPPTGDLTPSEAAGLGFEDFSGISGFAEIAAAPVAAVFGALTDADDEQAALASDQLFVPFDTSSGSQSNDAPEQARHFDDTDDLSGYAHLEDEVDSGNRPDFPTMLLKPRMPDDDLSALSGFASVFDTPVAARTGADNTATQKDEFVGEIHDLSSLAASLEDDIADALARAGEPVVDEPTPAMPGQGFTSMLASIGAEGLAPFDPRGQEAGGLDMSSEMALPDTDVQDVVFDQQATTASAAVYPSASMDIDQITQDWDSIDDEILRALPGSPSHGYTAELRSLSDSGLTPFGAEGDSVEGFEGIAPFDPFSFDPLAGVSFDTLLPDERNSVAPLNEPQMPTSDIQIQTDASAPTASAPNELAPIGEDDMLNGLQPFAFEEFDDGNLAASAKPGLGSLLPSWEASSGASAIPSDEDLVALLSLDDDMPMDFVVEQPAVDRSDLSDTSGLTSSPHGAAAMPDIHAAAEALTSEGAVSDLSVEQPELSGPADSESDLLQMLPGLTEADLDPFLASTSAVTIQLGQQEPLTFSQHQPDVAASDFQPAFDDMARRLTPGTELFTRARLVKREMLSKGLIGGTRELVAADASLSSDRISALEDTTDTRRLPETDDDLGAAFDLADDADDDDDDAFSSIGATRDTTTLRAALEVTPNDDELRWWLAEALRERGDMDAAYAEYRWIIRHAPERRDAILHSLQQCVVRDQGPEMAHRLIGDIYRRQGELARASNQATLALQVRRRSAVHVRQ